MESVEEQDCKQFHDYKHRNQQKHDQKKKPESQQRKDRKDKEKEIPQKREAFLEINDD